jgi:hypothetical protein
MRFIRILLLLILSTALWANEQQLNVGNIHIYYPESYRKLAEYTLNVLKNSNSDLTALFGESSYPIKYILVNSKAGFERKTGTPLPPWTAAVTMFPQKVVVVKTPDLNNSTLRAYRETIRHELVHLRQGFLIPLNITPTWFNEGLAVYITNQYDLQSRVKVSRALAQNAIIPLSALSDFLKYNHLQAELAYAESGTVIEFLIHVYGQSVLTDLFKTLLDKKDFYQSLYAVTDIEPGTLDFYWQKYINKQYRWIFLLDIQNIIWLIIPVLLVCAYFAKRFRNKKTLQKWNVEENEIHIE